MMSDLLKINVNEHTEKKGGLTYLSWAWAWAEVLKHDSQATWVVHNYGPEGSQQPCMWIGETAMVHTSVTVNGLRRECMLPVMDNRNNAVKNPDARKISDAIMRCMTKAIAMHGLGLYIYAGEDLPQMDDTQEEPPARARTGVMADVLAELPPLTKEDREYYLGIADKVADAIQNASIVEAYNLIVAEKLDNEQRIYLEAEMPSGIRSALKKEGERRRAEKAAAKA